MTYKGQKFSGKSDNQAFFQTLRLRINQYFENEKISPTANPSMVFKTCLMLSIYFVPYLILISGMVTNYLVILLLWILIGVGMAGIGLNIMHDANHGSYSSKKWLNKLLGYTMNVIGANAEIWKIQHNRLHHTYTNIEGSDDDIHTPSFLRFSPHRKRLEIHKYQYLYVWFFYGISTLSWVTSKEFIQLVRYRKLGLIRNKEEFRPILVRLILWKLLYYTYMLIIPLILIPAPVWFILFSFIMLHFTAGLVTSLIFQLAHVMPCCEFPLPDKNGTIDHEWAVHEMITTTNYSPNNKLFSWLIGGLNYQVEHHLFPNICHVHYRNISPIVSLTASEYGIPYHTQQTFWSALKEHRKMLFQLGRIN